MPPEGWPKGDSVLHVILVDASTGIVRALRSETLPLDFACDLHKAIRDQAALPSLTTCPEWRFPDRGVGQRLYE